MEDLTKFSDGIGTWNARWNMDEDDDMDVVQVDGHGSSGIRQSFHNQTVPRQLFGLDTAPELLRKLTWERSASPRGSPGEEKTRCPRGEEIVAREDEVRKSSCPMGRRRARGRRTCGGCTPRGLNSRRGARLRIRRARGRHRSSACAGLGTVLSSSSLADSVRQPLAGGERQTRCLRGAIWHARGSRPVIPSRGASTGMIAPRSSFPL